MRRPAQLLRLLKHSQTNGGRESRIGRLQGEENPLLELATHLGTIHISLLGNWRWMQGGVLFVRSESFSQ